MRVMWTSVLGRALMLLAFLCFGVLAVLLHTDTTGRWWIELLRYVPYPAWLLPAVLVLALSVGFGWGWRLLALAGLGLVLWPVMGWSWGLGRAEVLGAAQRMPLRVMTYNIKSYRAEANDDNYELLAAEITRQSPDLLLLQDAPHLNRPGRPLDPAMQAALAPYHWHGVGQYVIASRHPLKDCRTGNLAHGGPPWPYLRCTVQVGTQAVTVVNVHTLTPRQGLNAARSEGAGGVEEWRENFGERLAQARRLADDVALLPRPLIVAGDLNAPQASPVVQTLLATDLRDAYGEAGRGWGYTVGHALRPHLSFVRIDHILVSSELALIDAAAGSRWGSEHRPVVAWMLVPQ